MEQYKSEGTIDIPPAKVTTITEESKQIQSVESTVKQLQDMVYTQQQELRRLNREINRLKNDISDVITILRNRG